MKDKKIFFYVLGVIVLILVGIGCAYLFLNKNPERKVKETTTDNYVAYVKINPSVKLNYYQKCTIYKDGEKECEDPIVKDYELVNDDAKEIFKDVDLLKDKKDLASVIEVICETAEKKGISTKNVEVQSDWKELNTYLEESAKEETEDNTEKEATITHSVTVDVKETETIKETIEEDVKEEIRVKEEAEARAKAEAEAKAKAEAEAKAKKAAQTIYLKDNVKYTIGGRGYCCEGCISQSLINTFKGAKGYYVTSADANRIDYQKITSLSGTYNNSKYFGNDLKSKLEAAGAEECGGLGGGEEPLTSQVCKQFHLICE